MQISIQEERNRFFLHGGEDFEVLAVVVTASLKNYSKKKWDGAVFDDGRYRL